MKISRKTLGSPLFAVIFIALSTLISEQAFATCFQSTCENQDPKAMGCDTDAILLKSADTGITSGPILDDPVEWDKVLGSINLYYSPTCDAKWAQVMALGSRYYLSLNIKMIENTGTIFGEISRLVPPWSPATQLLLSTTMVAANRSMIACGGIHDLKLGGAFVCAY